jgi:hypothetical protein
MSYKTKRKYTKQNSQNKKYSKKNHQSKKYSKKNNQIHKKRKTRHIKKQHGGDYNEKQKKYLRKKFKKFGFDEPEISEFLIKMDKTSQLFANRFQSVHDQLNAYYESNNDPEERKNAIREWVNQMDSLEDMIETDVNSSFEADNDESEHDDN